MTPVSKEFTEDLPPDAIGRASLEDSGQASTTASDLLFDVVLYPNRSLRPAGFIAVMAVVVGISFIAGFYFFVLGAWPVAGFFGLDALLVYGAFRLNYRDGRTREWVRLSRDTLSVRRVLPSGHEKRWRIQPFWARVEIDDPVEHHSQLRIVSHGRSVIIGSFLAPEERGELAVALRGALNKAKETVQPSSV